MTSKNLMFHYSAILALILVTILVIIYIFRLNNANNRFLISYLAFLPQKHILRYSNQLYKCKTLEYMVYSIQSGITAAILSAILGSKF